jgi:hypothetical protein
MQNLDNLYGQTVLLRFRALIRVLCSGKNLKWSTGSVTSLCSILRPQTDAKGELCYDHRVINTAFRPTCNEQAPRDLAVKTELGKVFGVSPSQGIVADVLIDFLKIALVPLQMVPYLGEPTFCSLNSYIHTILCSVRNRLFCVQLRAPRSCRSVVSRQKAGNKCGVVDLDMSSEVIRESTKQQSNQASQKRLPRTGLWQFPHAASGYVLDHSNTISDAF